MPRPKSFDENELLVRALMLFWEKGYQKTSMKDLEVLFGLTAPSIYHTFGNKQDLFVVALDQYVKDVIEYRIAEYLGKSSNPIDDIEAFLRSAIGYLVKGKPRFGCLLTNTSIEIHYLVENVSQVIQKGLDRLKLAFFNELVRAKETGYLGSEKNPKDLAVTLFTSYQGILVLARLNTSDKELGKMIDSLIRTLE